MSEFLHFDPEQLKKSLDGLFAENDLVEELADGIDDPLPPTLPINENITEEDIIENW